jgi:NADP-dependent 3-hydroxy acid dehydrogenase YdfG
MSGRDVVVITGASAGVGRAVAREFGRRRARVGLLARGIDGLDGAKREIEELGGEATPRRSSAPPTRWKRRSD